MNTLKVLKEFMETKQNNRFGTKVFIEEKTWLMNAGGTLPKIDKYVVHEDIVAFIKDCFDDARNPGWAEGNMEAAMCYFTEGHVPATAVDELGFSPTACKEPIADYTPILT